MINGGGSFPVSTFSIGHFRPRLASQPPNLESKGTQVFIVICGLYYKRVWRKLCGDDTCIMALDVKHVFYLTSPFHCSRPKEPLTGSRKTSEENPAPSRKHSVK